jgi:16S rRNA (guanine966-N2)-methyltransferase
MPPIPNRTKSNKRLPKGARPNDNRRGKAPTSRGLVRIIAGKHRGRRLPVLVHEGLRPTGDRVKETLFNWLMHDTPQAICLDMYAGSGGLGIEALSRGACYCIFIEQDAKVSQQISDNLKTLREDEQALVLNKGALEADLKEFTKRLSMVFIDPPFGKNMVQASIDKLINENLLAPQAKIYLELGHDDKCEIPQAFQLLKQIKTSQALAFLYEFNPQD